MDLKQIEPIIPVMYLHVYLIIYASIALPIATLSQLKIANFLSSILKVILSVYMIVHFLMILALIASLFIDSAPKLDILILYIKIMIGVGLGLFIAKLMYIALFVILFPLFGIYVSSLPIKQVLKRK